MYTYKLANLRVIDGDTIDADIDLGFNIWLRKRRIRLRGIDCPETRTRDKIEKQYGFAALEYLKQLVTSTETVTLQSYGEGKFGRILGDLFVDEIAGLSVNWSINREMIIAHHAVDYHGQSKDDIKKEHLANRQKLVGSKLSP